MAEFEQMLAAVLPANGRTSLTLTESPNGVEQLIAMLETAIVSGNNRHSRLTEIHLPMRKYPAMGTQFWHVPVEDSGKQDVVRLVFEA